MFAKKYKSLLTAGLLVISTISSFAQITINSPAQRTVYQRNNSNEAVVPVRGVCVSCSRVEARLVARNGQGVTTDWKVIDYTPSNGNFSGGIKGKGGWYNLEVRGTVNGNQTNPTTLERVGIGEVFIIAGHSVAHGGVETAAGADDDRVQQLFQPDNNQYNNSANPDFLSNPPYAQLGNGARPGPFGYSPHCWGQFGQVVAQRANVPVLIFNAAFGGTSLEHWAKSSQGIPFEHGFVNSSIRMPYINLKNTLTKYIRNTGVRAILSDQGANDWPNRDVNQILGYYQTWVNQARSDLGFGQLAIVVNRATPYNNTPTPASHIREVQDRMSREPFCYPGPDYDTGLEGWMRPDGIHANAAGQVRMGQLWASVVTEENFLNASQPWQPGFAETPQSQVVVNTPPKVAVEISKQTFTVGQSAVYTIPTTIFTDNENNITRYEVSGLPSGLTASGLTISGVPQQAGSFTATVKAIDSNNESAQATLEITVIAATTVTPTTPSEAGAVTSIRFYPRADCCFNRYIGGRFEGSDDNKTWTTLFTITAQPVINWNTYNVTLNRSFRYLRYMSPSQSYGNVAEVEFYSGSARLTGQGFGTAGSFGNQGAGFEKALDGNVSTYFDGPDHSGNFVGIDTRPTQSNPGSSTITGSGSSTTTDPGSSTTVMSQPVFTGCYTVQNQQSRNYMQVMSDGTVGFQPLINGQANQIWKIETVGSQYRFVSQQNNSGQVIYVNAVTDGERMRVGNYQNNSRYNWTLEVSAANVYRIHSNGKTWDQTSAGSQPELQIYGDNIATDFHYNRPYRLFGIASVGCPTSTTVTNPGSTTTTTPGSTTTSTPAVTGAVTSIRFYPRADCCFNRYIGGRFEGSDDNKTWTTLFTITAQPVINWNTYSISTTRTFRYLRYMSPNLSYGNVAEVEFYSGSTRLTGQGFGSVQSSGNFTTGFEKALDGNVNTYFDAITQNGHFVGIDLGASTSNPGSSTSNTGTTNPGSSTTTGSGSSTVVTSQPVFTGCYTVQNQQSRNYMQVMSNGTVGFQPLANGRASQIWKLETVGTQYRFVSQQNTSGQVVYVNALSNGELMRVGNYQNNNRYNWALEVVSANVYSIQSNGKTWDQMAAGAQPELQIYGNNNTADPGYKQSYRLFRIASVGCPTSTTTTTPGSTTTTNPGSTTTTNPGSSVSIPGGVVTSIRFHPRADCCFNRYVGGRFEGSDDRQSWTTLFTITSQPVVGWNVYPVTTTRAFRYLRYLSPNLSYGNVAELEFYSGTTRLTGQGFGTAGSYGNLGYVFQRALDGDTKTYFDGPTPSGNFVGIDLRSGARVAVRNGKEGVSGGVPWKAYPTPVSEVLTIEAADYESLEKVTFRVVYLNGYQEDIVPKEVNGNKAMLDVAYLPGGLYVLLMRQEDVVRKLTFMKR